MARRLEYFEVLALEEKEKKEKAKAKREKTLFFKKAAEAGFSVSQVEFLWNFSKKFAQEYHHHPRPLGLMRF